MIDKFRFRTYKVLPLVYDEALSYYETLCALAKKVNECIDYINEDLPDYSELEEAVNTLNEKMEVVEGDIADIKAELALKGKVLVDEEIGTGSVNITMQNVDITNCTLLKVYPQEAGCPAIECVVTFGEDEFNYISGVGYDVGRNGTRYVITLHFVPETNKISYNRSYKTTDGTTMTGIKIDKIEVIA